MSTPTIGVLALQGDVREHVAMLERAGARAVEYVDPRRVRPTSTASSCPAASRPRCASWPAPSTCSSRCGTPCGVVCPGSAPAPG